MANKQKKYTRKVKFTDGDSGTYPDGTQFRLTNVRAPESNQCGGS